MKPSDVYKVLAAIGATKLYHANTVSTSCTFLEHGALLSRGYVEQHALRQTLQVSDALDKRYGIWNAVFVDHVDIHHRGGRKKGPNQYGPVLFVLDTGMLLGLPPGTDIRVTRVNPVHWVDGQTDQERWYESAGELAANLSYGDFDKMLVINTPGGKVDFPGRHVCLQLDEPKRQLSDGIDAYQHAEERLREAALRGRVVVDVAAHACKEGCQCVAIYGTYDARFFDSRFL